MKRVSFSIALLLCSSSSFAEQWSIKCASTASVARPESVAAVLYQYGTTPNVGSLGCAVARDGDFCLSIRMDLSTYVGNSKLESCRRGLDSYRQVLTYQLVQEDEFDNLVNVVVTRSCATGAVSSEASAIIANSNSHELPNSAEVVACLVLKQAYPGPFSPT